MVLRFKFKFFNYFRRSFALFEQFINGERSFIIAEVGQNHQGNEEKALKYIEKFAMAGADAIKFQKRDNDVLFDKASLVRQYENPNSFGKTYGEHRKKLELDPGFYKELKAECNRVDVKFMVTPFDEPSLEMLTKLDIDIFKIASFDLGNIPFISLIAELKKPVVLSVGGGKHSEIASSIDCIFDYHTDVSVLHCVSEYPCPAHHLGLQNIEKLKDLYPNVSIGLSDHFNGILSGPVGYMKGARVFEKHVTFDRSQAGSDHAFSLEPEGFTRFCRDIRRVSTMLPSKLEETIGTEDVFKKLGKSLVAKIDLEKGDVLSKSMLTSKIISEEGIPVRESSQVIGRTVKSPIKRHSTILPEHLD